MSCPAARNQSPTQSHKQCQSTSLDALHFDIAAELDIQSINSLMTWIKQKNSLSSFGYLSVFVEFIAISCKKIKIFLTDMWKRRKNIQTERENEKIPLRMNVLNILQIVIKERWKT